jgi:thiolase-like protein
MHMSAAPDSGRLSLEIHLVEIARTRNEPGRPFEQFLAANDGASAVALASREVAAGLGAEPLARVVASATHALDPQVMGIAPAFAIPKARARAGLASADIDLWDFHEAYASGRARNSA